MVSNKPRLKRSGIVEARHLDRPKHALSIPFGLLSVMQNVAVVGPSKAGMTSILLRLAAPLAQREHGLDPSHFLFCYISLGGLECVNPQEFFELMLSGMIRAASRRPPLTYLQAPLPGCDSTFSQLLCYLQRAEMAGPNLVWTLDEFDTAARNPRLDLNFFSALRALVSSPRAALVIATRHSLYCMREARRPVGSSLADLFVTLTPGHLRVRAS